MQLAPWPGTHTTFSPLPPQHPHYTKQWNTSNLHQYPTSILSVCRWMQLELWPGMHTPPTHPNIPATQNNATHQTYGSVYPLCCLSVGGCSLGQGRLHPLPLPLSSPSTPTSPPHKAIKHINPTAVSSLYPVSFR